MAQGLQVVVVVVMAVAIDVVNLIAVPFASRAGEPVTHQDDFPEQSPCLAAGVECAGVLPVLLWLALRVGLVSWCLDSVWPEGWCLARHHITP